MIIKFLTFLANFLIRILEGLAEFLKELIPLLLKNAFLASPFILVLFGAYRLGGGAIFLLTLIVVLVVCGVGWAWARGRAITELRRSAVLSVITIDIFLLFLLVSYKSLGVLTMSRTEQAQLSSLAPSTRNSEKTQEKPNEARGRTFTKALEVARNNNNHNEVRRLVQEIRNLKYLTGIPVIHRVAEAYCMSSNGYFVQICKDALTTLVEFNATATCALLYEIEAQNPDQVEFARSAAAKLCDK